MLKISGLNLCSIDKGLSKLKNILPFRGAATCRPIESLTPTQSDHDYSRISATSVLRESSLLNSNALTEKPSENFLAEQRRQRCKEILKEHYLRKLQERRQQESEIGQLPEMSQRLRDIMAMDAALSVTKKSYGDNLKLPASNGSTISVIDFKPQNNCNMNRWRLRIPFRKRLQTQDLKLKVVESIRLGKKARKVIRPPGSAAGSKKQKAQQMQLENILKLKTVHSLKMWHFGARTIPRLS